MELESSFNVKWGVGDYSVTVYIIEPACIWHDALRPSLRIARFSASLTKFSGSHLEVSPFLPPLVAVDVAYSYYSPVINDAINRKNTFLCTMKAFIISDFIGTILIKKGGINDHYVG